MKKITSAADVHSIVRAATRKQTKKQAVQGPSAAALSAAATGFAEGKKKPVRRAVPAIPDSIHFTQIHPLPPPRQPSRITRAELKTLLDSVAMPKEQRGFTQTLFNSIVPKEGLEAATPYGVLENLFTSIAAQAGGHLENDVTLPELRAYATSARGANFWGTITNMMLEVLKSRKQSFKDPLQFKELRQEFLSRASEIPGPPEALSSAG